MYISQKFPQQPIPRIWVDRCKNRRDLGLRQGKENRPILKPFSQIMSSSASTSHILNSRSPMGRKEGEKGLGFELPEIEAENCLAHFQNVGVQCYWTELEMGSIYVENFLNRLLSELLAVTFSFSLLTQFFLKRIWIPLSLFCFSGCESESRHNILSHILSDTWIYIHFLFIGTYQRWARVGFHAWG